MSNLSTCQYRPALARHRWALWWGRTPRESRACSRPGSRRPRWQCRRWTWRGQWGRGSPLLQLAILQLLDSPAASNPRDCSNPFFWNFLDVLCSGWQEAREYTVFLAFLLLYFSSAEVFLPNIVVFSNRSLWLHKAINIWYANHRCEFKTSKLNNHIFLWLKLNIQ